MAAKPQIDSIDQGTGRSTRKALLASVGLSILFLIVYGGCNWITSQRANVGTFYFEWERRIPFVPFFILPYMSIDLFFSCRAVSLPDRARIVDLSQADRGGDYRRRNVFPTFSASLRVPAAARRRVARRDLRLVSRNGRALQFATVAPRSVNVDSGRGLFALHARLRANRDYHWVCPDRTFTGDNVSN